MSEITVIVDEIKADFAAAEAKVKALIEKLGVTFHLTQVKAALEQGVQALDNHLATATVTSDPVAQAEAAVAGSPAPAATVVAADTAEVASVPVAPVTEETAEHES